MIHGGNKIIPREESGRFKVYTLGCKYCVDCGQIIEKEQQNVGSEQFPLLKDFWAETCPNCGSKNIR